MESPPITKSHSRLIFGILLAAATLISLTACKAEVNLVVDEEGNGKIEIVGAVNDAILSLARLGGEDPFEDLYDLPEEELESDGLEGASIEPYQQGGYTGIRISADFDPYDPAITALSNDASILGNLTDSLGLDRFQFTRTDDDDGWIVELKQATDQSVTNDFGDLMGDIPFDVGELDLPFIFSLQMPGEYVEHNADREVNGVLIWDANLLEGIDVYARIRDPGFQLAIGPIIITALFLLIGGGIVVGVVVSRVRRQRREKEDAAMEAKERESQSTTIELID